MGDFLMDSEYKKALKEAMEILAKDERTVFIGYNVAYGSKGFGSFADIKKEKLIETPVAENLMTGLAIGMALEGYRPILFFERHDFMLIALDALVNHLDVIEILSDGEFKVPVIIRAIIGGSKPINPGILHTQDFTEIFKKLFKFKVHEVRDAEDIINQYKRALSEDKTVMLIERKDLYH